MKIIYTKKEMDAVEEAWSRKFREENELRIYQGNVLSIILLIFVVGLVVSLVYLGIFYKQKEELGAAICSEKQGIGFDYYVSSDELYLQKGEVHCLPKESKTAYDGIYIIGVEE